MKPLFLSVLFVAAFFLWPHGALAETTLVEFPGTTGPGYSKNYNIRGKLTIPDNAPRPMPAVVIFHGTGGIDGRGWYHSQALNAAGFATLEIKMFNGGIRPKSITAVPFAFGSLRYLASRDDIDAKRIGAMGFSFGASLTFYTAIRKYAESQGGGHQFAAHVTFYGSCQAYEAYLESPFTMDDDYLTGAPMLIQEGGDDDYNKSSSQCTDYFNNMPKTAQQSITHVIYPGATHIWDSQARDQEYSYWDQDGLFIHVRADAELAAKSRLKAVSFFQKAFGLPETPVVLPRGKARWRPDPFEIYLVLDTNDDGRVSKDEFLKAFKDKQDFSTYDSDGDGFATLEEILAVSGQPGAGQKPDPAAVIKNMDKDGDGKVSVDEFSGPKDRFGTLDTDGDGFATLAEMQAVLGGQGKKGGDGGGPDPEKMLKAMDTDGDGKISAGEFKGPAQRFRSFDVDGDGYLNALEFSTVMAKKQNGQNQEEKKEVQKQEEADQADFFAEDKIRKAIIGNTIKFKISADTPEKYIYFSGDGIAEMPDADNPGATLHQAWSFRNGKALCRDLPNGKQYCVAVRVGSEQNMLIFVHNKKPYKVTVLAGNQLPK